MASARQSQPSEQHEHDNVFVCYTPQNYLKALYLAYRAHEEGQRSKIIALFVRDIGKPSFLCADAVYWADIEYMPHSNGYIRVFDHDKKRPAVYLSKLARKACSRFFRFAFQSGERSRLLRAVGRTSRVYLFVESSYFSTFLLSRRVCTLVDEGLATYKPYRTRALGPGDWQFPGEHPNIDTVLLQYPELAADAVRSKVQPLELRYRDLPRDVREILLPLFGLDTFRREERSMLLVGQAWSYASVDFAEILEFYRAVIDLFQERGYRVWLKPHPSESIESYQSLGCEIIDPCMPLEAFEFRGEDHPFEVAVSLLGSSLANVPHLARTNLSFLNGVVVEDVRRESLSAIRIDKQRLREVCFEARSTPVVGAEHADVLEPHVPGAHSQPVRNPAAEGSAQP